MSLITDLVISISTHDEYSELEMIETWNEESGWTKRNDVDAQKLLFRNADAEMF